MQIEAESPRIVRRHCGGWLALAPESASLKIGVSADSEDVARNKYRTAVEEWKATLALGGVAVPGECGPRADVIDTRA
jgi:hypothetical protein